MEAAGSLTLVATELDCVKTPKTEIWIFVGVGNTCLTDTPYVNWSWNQKTGLLAVLVKSC